MAPPATSRRSAVPAAEEREVGLGRGMDHAGRYAGDARATRMPYPRARTFRRRTPPASTQDTVAHSGAGRPRRGEVAGGAEEEDDHACRTRHLSPRPDDMGGETQRTSSGTSWDAHGSPSSFAGTTWAPGARRRDPRVADSYVGLLQGHLPQVQATPQRASNTGPPPSYVAAHPEPRGTLYDGGAHSTLGGSRAGGGDADGTPGSAFPSSCTVRE